MCPNWPKYLILNSAVILLENASIDLLDIKSHCLDDVLKKMITDFDPLCSNDVIYRGKISIRF